MIFSTAHQAGQTDRDTRHQLGAAARRCLDVLLSELYQPVTQEWLARHLPDPEDCLGLQLTGENSEDCFPFAALPEQVCACRARTGDTVRAFDFVYARIWVGSLSGLDVFIQSLRQNLKASGSLLLEFVSLSGFSAYPYNHALAHSMELIDLLETPRSGAALLPERIQVLLQQAGFDTLEIISALPAFIPRACNRAVSLALEACREAILHCRGSTAEELNALLLELKEFEAQGDTLISRPGLLQVLARQQDQIPAQ